MTNMELKQKTALLLTAFRAGDNEAFAKLYDMYVQPMYNYGMRLTSNSELIKDCIHDVFVRIYSKRGDRIDNFYSYLIISLKNRILDEYRKQTNASDIPSEEYHTLDSGDDIEHSYIMDETECSRQSKVARLLDVLTPRQRQAFELYYIEERKYDDICRIMNMNYHSVRNLVHRGMLKLRENRMLAM